MEPQAARTISFRAPAAVLAAVAFLWALTLAAWPPLFSGHDVFYFKDAGLNLAEGRGFVTGIGPGHPDLEPGVYSLYPPLFPALYGAFAWVSGTGPRGSVAFDLALTFVGALGYLVLLGRYLSPRGRLVLAAILGAGLGGGGVLLASPERPETLAFVLTMAALLAVERGWWFRAGVSAGLNVLVSPFCLVAGVLLLPFLMLRIPEAQARGPRLRVAAGTATSVAGGIAVIALLDPQILLHIYLHGTGAATDGATGTSYARALLTGDFAHYAEGLRRVTSGAPMDMRIRVLSFGVAVLASGLLALADRRRLSDLWPIAIAAAGLAMGTPLLFVYQPAYWTFVAPLVLWLTVRLSARERARQSVALAAVGLLAAASVLLAAKRLADARAAAGTFDEAVASLRATIPEGTSFVGSDPSTYFAVRAAGFTPVNNWYLMAGEHRQRVPWIAGSYPGSGNPSSPARHAWFREEDYDAVLFPQVGDRTHRFLGRRTNSSYTWQVALWRLADVAIPSASAGT